MMSLLYHALVRYWICGIPSLHCHCEESSHNDLHEIIPFTHSPTLAGACIRTKHILSRGYKVRLQSQYVRWLKFYCMQGLCYKLGVHPDIKFCVFITPCRPGIYGTLICQRSSDSWSVMRYQSLWLAEGLIYWCSFLGTFHAFSTLTHHVPGPLHDSLYAHRLMVRAWGTLCLSKWVYPCQSIDTC
jgi:hypothetical protein